MIRGPKAGLPWALLQLWPTAHLHNLPKDPDTMDDPGVLVEKRLLWDQVHKPFPKRDEPG
ncbi:hypothetical protein LX36DRAFT_655920 [Colletotrichum falcatum]|nr:hypothetical protein LX36DRAFT_655920 [Colletotrichum falcatum]